MLRQKDHLVSVSGTAVKKFSSSPTSAVTGRKGREVERMRKTAGLAAIADCGGAKKNRLSTTLPD